MTYTIKNLREVEDAAVKGGFSETQEAHFATGDLDARATGLSYHLVRPGRHQAFGHRHEEAEEVYVVQHEEVGLEAGVAEDDVEAAVS